MRNQGTNLKTVPEVENKQGYQTERKTRIVSEQELKKKWANVDPLTD